MAANGTEAMTDEQTKTEALRVLDSAVSTIDLVRVEPDGDETVLVTRCAGEYFGEMGPLFSLSRAATARARAHARVTGYRLKGFKERFGLTSIEGLVRPSTSETARLGPTS